MKFIYIMNGMKITGYASNYFTILEKEKRYEKEIIGIVTGSIYDSLTGGVQRLYC